MRTIKGFKVICTEEVGHLVPLQLYLDEKRPWEGGKLGAKAYKHRHPLRMSREPTMWSLLRIVPKQHQPNQVT